MKRRYDYDVLRVLSMLGVIYLHTVAGCLRDLTHVAVWDFSNILVAISTPAVPLFFMMSGALHLRDDRSADLNVLFRHRIPKVLVPLLAYTALVLIGHLILGAPSAAITDLKNVLNTPVLTPYWFLYALIPMYLITPMLKKMTDGLSMTHWHYMMALWLIVTIGLYTLRSFLPYAWWDSVTVHWTLNINMIGGYLGYYLLGAYLERLKKIPSKKILVGVVIFMLLISIFGTRLDTFAHGAYSDRFTNYLSLFTAVLSAAIFLLAKSCLREKKEKGKVLPLLAGISFGVYMIHPLAIKIVGRIWNRITLLPDPATIPQQIVLYGCITLVCIVGAVILSSIKPLCYLFTGQTFSTACKSSNLFALFAKKESKE